MIKKDSMFKKEFLQEFSPVCLVCLLFLVQYKYILKPATSKTSNRCRERKKERKRNIQSPLSFLKKIKISLRQRRQLVIERSTYFRAARPE